MRVLDRCSFGGLGLDPFVFNQLDTDGHGAVTGHLTVSYQFVTVGETLIGTSSLVPVTHQPALTCMYSTRRSR